MRAGYSRGPSTRWILHIKGACPGMALVHDSPNDFVLYPKDHFNSGMAQSRAEGYSDMPYPVHNRPNTLPQFGDVERSTYGSYPAVSAYAAAPSIYYSIPPYTPQTTTKQSQHPEHSRYTPAASPSPSISQGLDHPPSNLSSTSGASVQSTASSAVGSPHARVTHNVSSQDWIEAQHGLGIAPSIIHNDAHGHDPFSMLPMDADFPFDEHKFPSGFVGESSKIPSSSVSSSHGFPSSVSSYAPTQSFLPAVSSLSSSTPLDNSVNPGELTIDTILEEAARNTDSPVQLGTPVSASSAQPSPKIGQTMLQPRRASSLDQQTFVSPTIPASAMSPFPRKPSPGQSHRPGPRRHTMMASTSRRASGPPLAPSARYAPYARPAPPLPLPPPSPAAPSSSPFLGQSSGGFGPPLQSSCWFPY